MDKWYFMPAAILTYAGCDLSELVINVVNQQSVARVHPTMRYSFAQQSSSLLYAPVYDNADTSFEQRIHYLSANLIAAFNLEYECTVLQLVVDKQQHRCKLLIDASKILHQKFDVSETINHIDQLNQITSDRPILLIAVDSLIHKPTIDVLAKQGLIQAQHHPEGIAVSEAAIAILLSRQRIDNRQRQLSLVKQLEEFADASQHQPAKLIAHYSLRKQLFSLLNFQRQYLIKQSIHSINIAHAIGDSGCCNFLITLAIAYYYARPNQTQCCLELTDMPRMACVN